MVNAAEIFVVSEAVPIMITLLIVNSENIHELLLKNIRSMKLCISPLIDYSPPKRSADSSENQNDSIPVATLECLIVNAYSIERFIAFFGFGLSLLISFFVIYDLILKLVFLGLGSIIYLFRHSALDINLDHLSIEEKKTKAIAVILAVLSIIISGVTFIYHF